MHITTFKMNSTSRFLFQITFKMMLIFITTDNVTEKKLLAKTYFRRYSHLKIRLTVDSCACSMWAQTMARFGVADNGTGVGDWKKKRTADRTRRHPLPSCHEMTPPPPFPLAAAPAPARPRAAPPPSRRFPSRARGVRGREHGRRCCCSRAAVCSDRTTDPLRPSLALVPPQPSALLVCFCCQ